MKLFSLFLLILSNLRVIGQSLHPMMEDSSYWKITATFPGPPGHYCSNLQYYEIINGDTIINTITYKKVYKIGQNCTDPYFSYLNNGLKALIREDTLTHKVFRYNGTTNNEDVIYDYSLNIGDTVHSPLTGFAYPVVVYSKDSILVNNRYQRRLGLLSSPNNYGAFLIETIGSSYGLLSRFYDGKTLHCVVYKNLTHVFPTSATPCSTINFVGLDDNNSLTNIIFPNPSNGIFTIKSSILISKIEIKSITGQTVYEENNLNLLEKTFSLTLAKGIYFIIITNTNDSRYFEKLVVN